MRRFRPGRTLSVVLALVVLITLGAVVSGAAAIRAVTGGAVPDGMPGRSSANVQTPMASTAPLAVMSFNIRHGVNMDGEYNLPAIAGVINAHDVVLVGLQEVDRRWSSRSNEEDQPALLAGMTGTNACYGPNLTNASAGQYGNLILSKYPILECRNTLLPKFNPSGEQRGLLEVLVEVEGRRLRFYNTHLHHASAGDRRVQVDAIVKHMVAQPELKVLTGDLNAVPSAAELQPLFARLADTWQAKGKGDGFTIPSDGPTRRIDYVLVSTSIAVNDARVVNTTASDHLPVLASVTLP